MKKYTSLSYIEVRKRRRVLGVLALFLPLAFSIVSEAQTSSFTYEGRLFSSSGVPLSESVDVKFQILNPAATCVLYEEVQTGVDLSTSKGAFSLGVGSAVSDTKRSANFRGAYNPSMVSVFRNGATLAGIPAAGCAAGSYVAGASDNRLLRVQITKGSTTETLAPDLVINTVPSAQVAASLQGFLPSDFLRLDVANGISGNIGLTATGTGAGQTREFRFYELAANGAEYSAFKAPDAQSTSLTYTLPSGAPTVGQILSATTVSGGAVTLSWTNDAGAGGGISNFNGSNQSSQSFTAVDIAAAVTAPAWSTNAGTGAHTLQIPMASGAGVTGGLITKTEHTAFSSKVDRAGDTMTGLLNFTGATGVSLAGTSGITFTGTGTIAMGTNKITGMADPSAAQEAATKAYVDSQSSGKIGGTLTATRIPYASGASTLVDSANFTYTPASGAMTIGGTAPSVTSNDTITIAAGGTNKNVVLTPSGTGYTLLNGNVGIGTTSPATSLDIVGGGIKIDRTGNSSFVWFNRDGTSVGQIRGYLTPNTHLSLTNPTGATEYFMVDTSNGNVGIGTTNPLAKFHVLDGALLATGTSGATPISGAGARMMWIPAKSAFRAGTVGGTQWDDANIGIGSTAFGFNTIASGTYSTALGYQTQATAGDATAIGNGAQATGGQSISIGYGTLASAQYAIALGFSSISSGVWSTTTGNGSTASGQTSTAMGSNSTAGGLESFAVGTAATANSVKSKSVGVGTTADSHSQVTVGSYNQTQGTETAATWVTTDPIFVVGNGTSSGSKSTALMVLKNGNVGIGTTSPATKVDISGTDADGTLRVYDQTATTGITRSIVRAGAGQTTTNLMEWQDAAGTILSRVDSTGKFVGDGSLLTGISGAITGLTAGRVPLSTSATSISDSANLTFNSTTGAMGLGGSAPSITSSDAITIAAGGTNKNVVLTPTGTGRALVNGAADAASYYVNGIQTLSTSGSHLIIHSTGTKDIAFWPSGTEAMRIASGGNVGIGTTSPTNPLHVVGDIHSDAYAGSPNFTTTRYNGTSGSPTAIVNGDTLSGWWVNGWNGSGISTSSAIVHVVDSAPSGTNPTAIAFWTRGTNSLLNEKMRLSSDGNVGIGTTNPTVKLDVRAGASNLYSRIENTSTGYDSANIYSDGTYSYYAGLMSGTFSSTGVYSISNGGSSTESLSLASNGNVGVGTIAPVSRLHVRAAPVATANYGLVSLGNGAFNGSTAGYFGTGASSSSAGTVLAVNTASGYTGDLLNLQINGVQKFKVDKDGILYGDGSQLSNLASASIPTNVRTRSLGYVFDGGGAALSSGRKAYYAVPFSCTIAAWTMTVDTGTATVDVWKRVSGGAIPTVADTITASAVPAISSGTNVRSTTLTGWTTAVAANDILGFHLSAVSSATLVSLVMECLQ